VAARGVDLVVAAVRTGERVGPATGVLGGSVGPAAVTERDVAAGGALSWGAVGTTPQAPDRAATATLVVTHARARDGRRAGADAVIGGT
jgi:hypothetical protein